MGAGDRDRLVEQHLPLVEHIARKVRKQITARVPIEDLCGYGSKGLIEAAERFDPRHGVAFTTFAHYRIRGAMLDGLRTMGWYSRSDYARYRAEERANEYLQNTADREGAERAAAAELGRGGGAATPPAGAAAAGAGATAGAATTAPATAATTAALAGVAEILGGIAAIHITSLEAANTVADERLPAPDAHIDTGRVGARIRAAVQTLPERERQLIELYYFGDKNLEEAGEVLGMSKSWACRLHARAVGMLHKKLADLE